MQGIPGYDLHSPFGSIADIKTLYNEYSPYDNHCMGYIRVFCTQKGVVDMVLLRRTQDIR